MAIALFQNLFAVMADPSNLQIVERLNQYFPDDYIAIRSGQWFVVGPGTARDVSDKLQVTPENITGAAVVVAVSGYYGRASSQVWEWVASKVGQPVNVK